MKTITLVLTIIFLFFILTSLWAVDVQNVTLKELVTERPDLVQGIKAGKDKGTLIVSVTKDAQGRMSIWISERWDIDGNLIEKLRDVYSYYPTKELDTIIQEKYNKKNILVKKIKLKHYRDGSQPDIEAVVIGGEIPKK